MQVDIPEYSGRGVPLGVPSQAGPLLRGALGKEGLDDARRSATAHAHPNTGRREFELAGFPVGLAS